MFLEKSNLYDCVPFAMWISSIFLSKISRHMLMVIMDQSVQSATCSLIKAMRRAKSQLMSTVTLNDLSFWSFHVCMYGSIGWIDRNRRWVAEFPLTTLCSACFLTNDIATVWYSEWFNHLVSSLWFILMDVHFHEKVIIVDLLIMSIIATHPQWRCAVVCFAVVAEVEFT